jgi:glutaconate CoA-transferase subunit A
VQEKLTSLHDAISLIGDGDIVALQNMATQAAPMALVREMIRQEKREIGLVVLVGGIAVDWLAAAGVINRLIGAAVSMEQFGLCQQYRRCVEKGRIRVEELSETLLNARLGAGARQLPFLPSRGAIGTDLIAQNPDNLRMIEDPFGGRPVVACRAMRPDVALIHAHRADRYGNIQMEATAMWPDIAIMPKAARKVIVGVEEIVDSDVLRRNPEKSLLPGFIVDAVVEIPFGAHPTSFFPDYGYDSKLHEEWVAVARDDEAARAFLQRHVFAPRDQAKYLKTVGGRKTVKRIRAWEKIQ